MNIRKDDTVLVITGKYKGKKGKVLRAMPRENRLVVEGVNMVKKHQKPTQDVPQGGIFEKEGPVHRSNVMLICPRCSKPVRSRLKVIWGNKVRVCRKCGEAIDK